MAGIANAKNELGLTLNERMANTATLIHSTTRINYSSSIQTME